MDRRHLHEEILLLALPDHTGALPAAVRANVPTAMAAGGLGEAMLAGSVVDDGDGYVRSVATEPTGDIVLDTFLRPLAAGRKPALHLVRTMASSLWVRRAAEKLVEDGVLTRVVERKLIREVTRWPTADPRVEEELVARMAAPDADPTDG